VARGDLRGGGGGAGGGGGGARELVSAAEHVGAKFSNKCPVEYYLKHIWGDLMTERETFILKY